MRRAVASWLGRRAPWSAVAPARRNFHRQTVQSVLSDVRARLSAVGVTGSDAKALVAGALQPALASSNELFLWMDRELRLEEAQKLENMVQRREAGEPLAYVVGVKEFWSLEFHVTSDTLIPRADSECLIESLTEMYPKTARLRILDLGTGSGALLLSALAEYPEATGVGVDISKGALAVAVGNANRLGLGDRSDFIEFDMEMLPAALDSVCDASESSTIPAMKNRFLRQFDVILCNPPYIPLSEVPLIAPDVLAHEPHGALFSAGPDAWKNHNPEVAKDDAGDGDELGLRFYISLRDSVDKLLDPASPHTSTVLIEIGSERQAYAVRDLFNGVSSVTFHSFLLDAGGCHRGVVFRSNLNS